MEKKKYRVLIKKEYLRFTQIVLIRWFLIFPIFKIITVSNSPKMPKLGTIIKL